MRAFELVVTGIWTAVSPQCKKVTLMMGNHRPISLPCALCKLMERIIKDELMSLLVNIQLKLYVLTSVRHLTVWFNLNSLISFAAWASTVFF